MWGRQLICRPSRQPRPGREAPRVEQSLRARGLGRTTSDPLVPPLLAAPESWSAESPVGFLREYESRPVPLSAGSALSSERRGKRFPGTHLEPVVNISPGFPSTNSSAPALPSPPPTYLAAEGPPSLSSPSSLRPSALPPATHQRGRAARGAGRRAGRRGRGWPRCCPIQSGLCPRASLRVQLPTPALRREIYTNC